MQAMASTMRVWDSFHFDRNEINLVIGHKAQSDFYMEGKGHGRDARYLDMDEVGALRHELVRDDAGVILEGVGIEAGILLHSELQKGRLWTGQHDSVVQPLRS